MTNLLDNEVFAITKRCSNRKNSLNNDRFPASGTNFSLNDCFKTADRRLSKWPPAVQNGSPLCLGQIPCLTGTGKWLPYEGSSLHDEVFRPLECIEPVFNAFQWVFSFCLTRISFYSDFAGMDYPRQARHHCIWNFSFNIFRPWISESVDTDPMDKEVLLYFKTI